ncbi:MAG TPA: hypothetical protein DCZ06_01760 [Alphaproteobacteria bacterium]|nr:hypothetical protein [Alphaproteobacteria bacterium]
MSANSRFSKGGSSAFLKTLKTRRSSRETLDRAIPILADLQSGDTKTEELQKKYPLAERVVAGLVADGLVSYCDIGGEQGVRLTENGEEFVKRGARISSKF